MPRLQVRRRSFKPQIPVKVKRKPQWNEHLTDDTKFKLSKEQIIQKKRLLFSANAAIVFNGSSLHKTKSSSSTNGRKYNLENARKEIYLEEDESYKSLLIQEDDDDASLHSISLGTENSYNDDVLNYVSSGTSTHLNQPKLKRKEKNSTITGSNNKASNMKLQNRQTKSPYQQHTLSNERLPNHYKYLNKKSNQFKYSNINKNLESNNNNSYNNNYNINGNQTINNENEDSNNDLSDIINCIQNLSLELVSYENLSGRPSSISNYEVQ